MLYRLKELAKKIVPASVIGVYHWFLSYAAALAYGFPSEKLIVIGVTGTNGKSTTVSLIAKILEAADHRVGATSTVLFKVAEWEKLNDTKMTMLGRFQLQKLLRRMVEAGCKFAVVEISSQGIIQSRHKAINYDAVVFTNLTPEHIEAHGGFENYKKAKLELFRHLTSKPRKNLRYHALEHGSSRKIIVANADDEHAQDFLAFPADKKYIFSIRGEAKHDGLEAPLLPVIADNLELTAHGSSFTVRNTPFHLRLLGKFNVSNALAAITVGTAFGVTLETAANALAAVPGVAGRLESICEGQPFSVIVDYAPEPVSLARLYEVLKLLKHKRLIHVLGSTGGGRDVSRRPILGEMAGREADVVIVTNEDPYDDDPMQIIEDVAAGVEKSGKIEGENLFRILDRRSALQKAVSLAVPGDLVLATGKGSEQAMVVAHGKKIPWDEREELRKIITNDKLQNSNFKPSSNVKAQFRH